MKDKLVLIKLAVTSMLLVFVLSKLDLQTSLAALQHVRRIPFILALGTAAIEYPVKAIRWQLLLRSIGIQVPVTQLITYALVGRFFNLFMPGTIGGDIVRIHDIAESQAEAKISAGVTVIAERVFGVVGIVVTGGLALLFEQDDVIDPTSRHILTIAVLVTLASLGLLMMVARLQLDCVRLGLPMPQPLLKFLKKYDVEERLNSILQSFGTITQDHAITLKVILLSCVSQLVSVCFLFLTLRSLGVTVDPIGLMPMLSIIMLILLLPISIQGIGVREGLYILFLGQKGVASNVVLSALTIRYGVMIVPGIIGGIIFALRRKLAKVS